MPKTKLAYNVSDISKTARSIRQQLLDLDRLPSHVELLNILARSAGYRNFQHFRTQQEPTQDLTPPVSESPHIDLAMTEQTARYFNFNGQLTRWPSKDSRARLCMWVIWTHLPAHQDLGEHDMNNLLKDLNTFNDHALLRRALIDFKLVTRTPSGNVYRRNEKEPPLELELVLKLIRTKKTQKRPAI
ncbi:hypothetical protein GCM10017044_04080 [Kordiimonas sediminis]|uniref:DUF2087 domain-containing protein n=1 Tax=Kordiimonas sediminis TaxID=1735581 RepID=A0A919AJY4_9PROT|nr:DUF2087 domain-containing protein [Kordiimonas sediminis]GHF13284.1 hypothetical protein GCM10017044_04080 [Kordiimonas sediminis]